MAGALGFLFIALFGLVGVHAFLQGGPVAEDTPRTVASSFGVATLAGMNVLMLTSAGSTLDSTFSSMAKAISLDLGGVGRLGRDWVGSVSVGRFTMIAMAVVGNLPLFTGARILQATTISGTMVMGLAPVFVLSFLLRAPPVSFHLAFWAGISLGVLHVVGLVPEAITIGDGKYADLLGVNVYGLAICTALFVLPTLLPGAGAGAGAGGGGPAAEGPTTAAGRPAHELAGGG